jgi:Skp family chaperone for outer membrane proteins
MPRLSRKLFVAGLSCAGLIGAVAPSLWGQGQNADDPRRQAAGNQQAAPARPAALPPAVIGSVDIDRVFKEYEKVKDRSESFKSEVMKRQQELTRLVEKGKNAAEQLEKMKRDSPDYQKLDNEVTKIKAELEAKRAQYEREFAKMESDAMAALYQDVAQMVAAVAKDRKMTFVIKITNDPPSGDDPNSVMAGMAKSVIYSDPSTDITGDVIRYLNYNYQKAKPAAADAQTRPASATAAGANTAAPGVATKGATQR